MCTLILHVFMSVYNLQCILIIIILKYYCVNIVCRIFRTNIFIATNRKDPKDNKTSPLLDDPNGSRQGINVFLPGCLSACVSVCLDSAYNGGCPVPSLNFCLGWDLNPEISRLVALHANY